MEGCMAVNAEGNSGGLALMWREGVKVTVQNHSKHHIDSLVCFYGQADPNLRKQSWDMIRKVKSTVKEGWIVGGDFNVILNNAEKEGGRRKPKSSMNDFCDILEEMLLVDVKTRNGWFTWTNNREGSNLIKERLDRFLISEDIIEKNAFSHYQGCAPF
ncbi:hypothetical protein GOBAR_AA07819 [Gossypium barbadense]|uniref:Endonuclease/exonuclease/phosphatase domain-containing protein n=1 Tax=Gossypium barbadense TaxID=3634 RepID=A0A2P5YB61_GOSBA|nr:hypothetical protein GOBAR_AA07819 [Gossypium barbadense]